MKKILIILICFFNAQHIIAQTNYVSTGTWKYVNGNDTIEIYFKTAQLNVGELQQPVLIGFHKYIKNGQLIENTLNYTFTSLTDNKYSIIIFDVQTNDTKNVGNIKDSILNNTREILLTKVSPTTMNVRLTYIQGVRNNRPYGFTMPRHFILTRQQLKK